MLPSKTWRNAATLIITAGKTNFSRGKLNIAKQQNSTRNNESCVKYNYSLLMLQRSGKSSFMPNAEVFPGGTIDKADTSLDWLSVFTDAGYPLDSLKPLESISNHSPRLYESYKGKSDLAPEVAFRICAIRETFEEAGVLLIRNACDDEWRNLHNKDSQASFESNASEEEIMDWQQRVLKDPGSFLELCRTFNCVPDVWSLFEWTEWLTPLIGKKRFDTVFYITSLSRQPKVFSHAMEAVRVHWATPLALLDEFKNGHCKIEPPQFVELSRLKQFHDLECLRSFYTARECKGVVRYTPAICTSKDCALALYPGDHCFPAIEGHEVGVGANENGVFPSIDITLEDMLAEADNGLPLNRSLMTRSGKGIGLLNNFDVHGHRQVMTLPQSLQSAKL